MRVERLRLGGSLDKYDKIIIKKSIFLENTLNKGNILGRFFQLWVFDLFLFMIIR